MSGKPSVPDETNVPRPIMLIARGDQDGTIVLSLEAPGTDIPPLELGGGYRSFDQVLQVVMAALTAPAVAEDRVAGIEEALPTVNQLVDSVNDLTDQVGNLKTKIGWLEDEVADLRTSRGRPREEWGRSAPGGRIPRLGEQRQANPYRAPVPRRSPYETPQGQYHEQRNIWDDEIAHQPPAPVPRMPQRPAQPPRDERSTRETGERAPGEKRDLTVREGARPTFDRGSFEPHQPVGRVARGPGTPD